MKYLILLFWCFFTNILLAQFDDYHQLQLKGGSKLIGKVIHESQAEYWLKMESSDTIYVRRKSVIRLYDIYNNHGKRDNIPVLKKGFYGSLFLGVGQGNQIRDSYLDTVNRILFIPKLFNPNATSMLVYKGNVSFGYQFNRYLGLGFGFNHDILLRKRGKEGFNSKNVNIHFQGKLNYPLKFLGNTDFWMRMNVYKHVEITTGLALHSSAGLFNIGLGWYNSFGDVITENYLSFQLGFQF